jgi:hypothetical protein
MFSAFPIGASFNAFHISSDPVALAAQQRNLAKSKPSRPTRSPRSSAVTENSLTRVLSPPTKATPVRSKLRAVRVRVRALPLLSTAGQPSVAPGAARCSPWACTGRLSEPLWGQAILSEHDESYATMQDEAGIRYAQRSGFNTSQIRDFQVRRGLSADAQDARMCITKSESVASTRYCWYP